MNKEDIIKEIQRTAKENGNVPLGMGQFLKVTGIKRNDWSGKYWARWSDAVREAGFSPNTLQIPYEETVLLEKHISLTREIGRFPVTAEIQLQVRKDRTFPTDKTFFNRFGSKANLITRLAEHCETRDGYEDIIDLCAAATKSNQDVPDAILSNGPVGYAYLIKHGSRREYKIGKHLIPCGEKVKSPYNFPKRLNQFTT